MFVVCAQAPGRIDGVLVVLVAEVLITTHSACLLMRAALWSLPIGMRHGGLVEAFVSLRRHRKKSWRSPLDRPMEQCKGRWDISKRRRLRRPMVDERAKSPATEPRKRRKTSRTYGFDHYPTDHVTAAAPAFISPVTPTP